MLDFLILIILAYLIGSIPAGFLVARLQGIADIRAHGSGNIGATNVARVLGMRYFFLVFCLDAGKAYGYLWLAKKYTASPGHLLIIAGVLLLGNAYSIFLNFSGGKGVATLCGIFAYCAPHLFIAGAVCFLLAWSVGKRVGIASVVTLSCLPLVSWYLQDTLQITLFATLVSLFCIYLHRANIKQFFADIKCV